jgi:hypothetical protein
MPLRNGCIVRLSVIHKHLGVGRCRGWMIIGHLGENDIARDDFRSFSIPA